MSKTFTHAGVEIDVQDNGEFVLVAKNKEGNVLLYDVSSRQDKRSAGNPQGVIHHVRVRYGSGEVLAAFEVRR